MNSRQFHQARMKKCEGGKEEMQCKRQYRSLGISLWHSENFARIAKISQWQRKFRNASKIPLWPNFRYLAKVTVHSENSNFCYA